MLRRALPLSAVLLLLGASSAAAYVSVEGTGEPAFTNTTTNTQWMRAQPTSSYSSFRVVFRGYQDGSTQRFADATAPLSVSAQTPFWVNWAGYGVTFQEGHTYGICGTGYYRLSGDSSGIEFPESSNSCGDGTITSKLTATTIDLTPPQISVSVDGTAVYTNNPKLLYHIDYADALSPPFPANFVCLQIGGDPNTACNGAGAFAYQSVCSTPNAGAYRINSFDCNQDFTNANPRTPDGPITFCARAADSAIPDNPNSADQSQPATSANISTGRCGGVILDRTPPSVTNSPSATSVHVGDLVTFTASASDATSGVSGSYAWTWGDNTANGSGASTSHTFTQAGTYSTTVATSDMAGNSGTATRTITVTPVPSGGTPPGNTPPGNTPPGNTPPGTTPPAGSSGSSGGTTMTTAPTPMQISQAAGGGGTQATALGGLDVLVPKRFRVSKSASIPIALTAASPGKITFAMIRRGRVVTRGGTTVTTAGTLGFQLKLPRGTKPGAYVLKVTFTPAGRTNAITKTLHITLIAAKGRGARAATVEGGLSPVGVPAPSLPDGLLHPAPSSHQLPSIR